MRLELLDHRARRLVGVPDVVVVLLGEILVVGAHGDCGNAVEFYPLFDVLIVLRDRMLCGEGLLVCVGGSVHNVQVEELLLVGGAAVQHVFFREPSHFFLLDDKRK